MVQRFKHWGPFEIQELGQVHAPQRRSQPVAHGLRNFCGGVAAFLVIGMSAFGQSEFGQAALDQQRFNEVVIEPIPAAEALERPEIAACNCETGGVIVSGPNHWKYETQYLEPEESWYYLFGRAGGTYLDTPADTSFGGSGGLTAIVPLTDGLWIIGSANFNGYSGGEQYSGTIGINKMAIPSQFAGDRIGWSVMLDQSTDTGVGSPYMAGLRYGLNYSVNEKWLVGASWYDALTGGDVEVALPGVGTVTGSIGLADSVEAWVQYTESNWSGTFGVGYSEGFDSTTYRLGATRQLTDTMSLLVQGVYAEDGLWTSWVGLQFEFGGNTPSAFSRGCKSCDSYASSANRSTDIVRGMDESGAVSVGSAGLLTTANAAGLLEDVTLEEFFLINRRSELERLARERGLSEEELDEEDRIFARLRELNLQNQVRKKAEAERLALEQQRLDEINQMVTRNALRSLQNRGVTGGCPAAYPFLIISSGTRFCCTDPSGIGNCILAP